MSGLIFWLIQLCSMLWALPPHHCSNMITLLRQSNQHMYSHGCIVLIWETHNGTTMFPPFLTTLPLGGYKTPLLRRFRLKWSRDVLFYIRVLFRAFVGDWPWLSFSHVLSISAAVPTHRHHGPAQLVRPICQHSGVRGTEGEREGGGGERREPSPRSLHCWIHHCWSFLSHWLCSGEMEPTSKKGLPWSYSLIMAPVTAVWH